MSKIVIFGGTTEGRILSEMLSNEGIYHDVCVATEIGELSMQQSDYVNIHSGRMTEDDMSLFFEDHVFDYIIDATHPYADIVSENIKKASKKFSSEYIRVIRSQEKLDYDENIFFYESFEDAIDTLKEEKGNILLTTGSKNLKDLDSICDNSFLERLYVRILPGSESLSLCEESGINPRNIIAMYGPFSERMNEIQIKDYNICHLVTKMSGTAGGFEEKINAALKCNIQVHIIGRPAIEEGINVIQAFKILCKKDYKPDSIYVSLIGIGSGADSQMTKAAMDKIKKANVILGAKRMISPYCDEKETHSIYMPNEIVEFIEAKYREICNDTYTYNQKYSICVLFSGDSGFFSGAQKLYDKLIDMSFVNLSVLPGISSVSYFASKLGVSYSDANIISIHGKSSDKKEISAVVDKLSYHGNAFILLSNKNDIRILIDALRINNINPDCFRFRVGVDLSYPQENIVEIPLNAFDEVISNIDDKALCIAYIENKSGYEHPISRSIKDEEFIRGKVPMTKADIRHLCVSKLNLTENSVVYDIGAGTGSVSIEIALQHPSINVYAIEYKKEALELIAKNIDKFNVSNVNVCEAKAPDGLMNIPVATHAFIGGSSGNLEQIVELLIKRNPLVNIVVTGIAIETVAKMMEIVKKYQGELIQVQISSAKRVGDYSLMEGSNPIYIATITNE